MEGKLLNVYDDLEDIPLNTVDAFKTLTGSCSHQIERKHKDSYTGKVSAVMVFTCNFPPEYPPKVMRDAAFWERWEYVIFPYSYPVNPNFYAEVFTERMKSSFLNALLWMMVKIKKSGLVVTSDIQTVMHNWSINADPLYSFIETTFTPGDGKTHKQMEKSRVYQLYTKYCDENNIAEHRRKGTQTALTLALQAHGFFPQRRVINGKRVEVYESVTWKFRDEIQSTAAQQAITQT